MDPEEVPREEFKKWAKRNNLSIPVDREHHTIAKAGSLEISLGKYGNIHLTRHKHLSGENGEITFGDKQLTLVNERGEEYRITAGSAPL